MHRIVNTEQSTAWNGYEGSHWAAHQSRYDAVNSGFNDCLLTAAAIGVGDRVLDIGCGNGQSTRLAARLAAQGHATGVDLSEPMLARARATATAEGIANVAFVQGDAQVHLFPEGRFDVAVSRFGVMFFGDPVAAFRNIRRALRPGGRLAFVCLRGMDRSDLGQVLAALSEQPAHSGGAAAPAAPGAVSLADPVAIRQVLTEAGFEQTEPTAVEAVQLWGRDAVDAGEFLGGWGPVRHHLAQVDRVAAARARRALTEAMRAYEGPGGVRLRCAAWLVAATRA
ncbi:class I SAM-dependent methyltransferase [Peterkaempfera bronchialis]|uniref:Class I SAM-dependent methyltransferase n=1 Tax=Peterkaempfera bronchialis TaxID=2126346 RepID=A0A345T288_9ACTN|nr:class I SAM-dependent methyltransferase [Peterkaempfera bronchialis]AXI80093.1 class I SAM-dependent methyltransferase [Peterkaempfera bronchialis]